MKHWSNVTVTGTKEWLSLEEPLGSLDSPGGVGIVLMVSFLAQQVLGGTKCY